jgi:hypothetical protein
MYTVDTALVYDIFPQTISSDFSNSYAGRDEQVRQYVLITDDERYIFIEGPPSPGMNYYGRALVGDGNGDYGEFNAYTQENVEINNLPWVDNKVDITARDDQLEFEFDTLFRRAEEERNIDEILDEAENQDTRQPCDCNGRARPQKENIDITDIVESSVYRIRRIMQQLEEVLEHHMNRKSGEANALVVPTISESAAEHLYQEISELHDELAGSWEQ